ncbi:WD40-repeat-containing domain protein [Dipodascopsis tothii]|uniref:WD40-repeat-containing domain protein n=1 Tax=Dipodascopsis tothii TaxID=44089 RepID=UPI0034CE28E8
MAPASYLTARQRDDLNLAILQYLAAAGLPAAHASLKAELAVDDAAEAAYAERADRLLEKKWTSVVRLQKKIMDLESKVAALEAQPGNIDRTSRRVADPTNWLPRTARHTLVGHREAATAVAFHPVFAELASASDDASVRIWDWETGGAVKTLSGHTKPVLDVDYGGPAGAVLLASGSADLTIRLWAATDEYRPVRTLAGHEHSVSAVRFSADGRQLVSGSRDASVRVWDVASGVCARVVAGHTDWVRAVAVAPGHVIVSVGADRAVRVSDAAGPWTDFVGGDTVLECCAVAPATAQPFLAPRGASPPSRGSSPSSAGSGSTAATSPSIATAPVATMAAPTAAPAGPALLYVATGGRDRAVRVWAVARGRPATLVRTLAGHDSWVRAIAFHPCGRYLLSAADDRTVRAWDLVDGRCARVLDAHPGFVGALRWAPPGGDGAVRCVVASASGAGDVKVWT